MDNGLLKLAWTSVEHSMRARKSVLHSWKLRYNTAQKILAEDLWQKNALYLLEFHCCLFWWGGYMLLDLNSAESACFFPSFKFLFIWICVFQVVEEQQTLLTAYIHCLTYQTNCLVNTEMWWWTELLSNHLILKSNIICSIHHAYCQVM